MTIISQSLLQKLGDMCSQFGRFTFVGVVYEEEIDEWDFVLSADWLDDRRAYGIKIFAKELKNKLTEEEISIISRIVILPTTSSFISELRPYFSETSIENVKTSNVYIKRAYLLHP